MNKTKQLLRYLLADGLAAMLAWGLFFVFRKVVLEQGGWDATAEVFADSKFWLGIVLVPAGWLCLYAMQGMYRNVYRRARLKELQQTMTASLLGVLVLFFLFLLDDNLQSYRSYYWSFLFLLLVHFVLTYVPRLLITTRTVKRVHNREIGFPTLLVGSGAKAWRVYEELQRQEVYSGNLFVGCVSMDGDVDERLAASMPCLGGLADLRRVVEVYAVEEAIMAFEGDDKVWREVLMELNRCDELIVKIAPSLRDILFGSVTASSIFQSPLITINPRGMEPWQYATKRLFDVVLSFVAMVVLLPVYAFTALMVKLSSPGPVFYTQERVGKGGKPFRMHKFRSMYVDAEQAGPALSSDGDPRITPWGRFMRKVRLDEIPQFYNVLRGTMSLVGPRPERQYFIDRIVERAPEYLLLQKVKPGITSWGQVKYGYAENVDEMVERLRFDLLYLDNMSLATDIKILLYTAIIIVQGRGK
ncbi:MAG: sugar transferase [Bacteroidales bacterium]|nr:sugar transferase [Bacteroidales bacterium]